MKQKGILLLFVVTTWLFGMNGCLAASGFSDLTELNDYSDKEMSGVELESVSMTAQSSIIKEDVEPTYVDNHWLQDFEVHFFISLPFTAFFSYLSVMSVDTMVQGKFSPDFHQADIWMIAGFAVGSSIAVALGSINRVPDQSTYRTQELLPESSIPENMKKKSLGKVEVVRICY